VQGAPGARGFPGADGSAGPKVGLQKIQNVSHYLTSFLVSN